MGDVAQFPTSNSTLDISGMADDELACEVEDFVRVEIDRLQGLEDAIASKRYALEDMSYDDVRFRRRLKTEKQPLTLEKVQAIWVEVTKPDREAEQRAMIMRHKSTMKSEMLRYFVITNSRGNQIHVLAADATVARHIAWANDRIKDKQNGHIRAYDEPSIEKLPYANAVREALTAGWPGEVEIMGTKIVHPEKKLVFG